jgi:hypothetical protein
MYLRQEACSRHTRQKRDLHQMRHFFYYRLATGQSSSAAPNKMGSGGSSCLRSCAMVLKVAEKPSGGLAVRE